MRRSYMLVLLMVLFFTGCTPLEHRVILKPNSVSGIEGEKFQAFEDNDQSVDSFYLNGGEVEYPQPTLKRSPMIEQIPNFQANEFKSVKTANRATVKKDIQVSGGKVKVNVESIPLNEFVDFIFSSVLKMNYTVDKNIKTMKQPITLNMAKALPKKQVFMVVENILKNESVGITQEDNTLFIALSSKSKTLKGLSDRYMVIGKALSPRLKDTQQVLVFVPFNYITPKDAITFTRRLRVQNIKINALNNNIAVLSGEAFDVRQVLELIKIIDTPSMDNKRPYLVELENINVKKFEKEMKRIFESNAIPVAENIREAGIVLTAIEEINSLLVLSSKDSWIEMLKFWQKRLDVLSELDNEHAQLYIYKVQHRKSEELASLLSEVLSMAPSTKEEGVNQRTAFLDSNSTTHSTTTQRSINIKADPHTNSLMLNVTSAEYKKILPVIKKLDVLPLQVAVEVTLAEVTLTDTFNLGFEWALLNNKAVTGTPTQVSGAYRAALGGGAGVTSSLFTTNLTSLINSFAEQKKLEILSRPRLVILNNKTGNINVGQQVPTVSSEASAADLNNGSSVLRNISYVTTGMTLNLTPTINSNGILTLDINVVLSEAQTNSTSSIDSPLIVNRSLTTSAVMQSGNSILLGGIISHNKSDGNGGVPLLKDVKWIGDLFKAQSESHVKTELIILIKPKILKNSKELFEETGKYKILLTNLQKIINF